MKKTRRANEQTIRILSEADTGLRVEGIRRKATRAPRAPAAGEASAAAWASRTHRGYASPRGRTRS